MNSPTLTLLVLRRRQPLIPLNTKSSFLVRELLASAGAPRIGSSTPLRADTRSRAGCIVETGYSPGDIPRFPGPARGRRDSERFVPEASTRCLGACGSQPSLPPLALRSSSTRSVPPFRPREQLGPGTHSRDCAPWVFSRARISLGVLPTWVLLARGAAHPWPVAVRPPFARPGLRLPRLLLAVGHLLPPCRRSSLHAPTTPALPLGGGSGASSTPCRLG